MDKIYKKKNVCVISQKKKHVCESDWVIKLTLQKKKRSQELK